MSKRNHHPTETIALKKFPKLAQESMPKVLPQTAQKIAREWKEILTILKEIDLEKLGSTISSERTEEQNKYVRAIFGKGNAESAFAKIHNLMIEFSGKVTNKQIVGADDLLETHCDYLTEKDPFIPNDLFQKVKDLYEWVKENEHRLQINEKCNYILVTVYSVFTYYQDFQVTITEKWKDLCEQLKTIQEGNEEIQKILNSSQSNEKNNINISTLNRFILSADSALQGHTQSRVSQSTDEHLNKLSALADELVNAANRREKQFPNEKKIAAEIRLTINLHKLAPLPNKQQFIEKLTKLSKNAEQAFKRHRHSRGLRIITKILKCLSVIPLFADCIRFIKTGKTRIFSDKTHSKEIIDDLQKEVKKVLSPSHQG